MNKKNSKDVLLICSKIEYKKLLNVRSERKSSNSNAYELVFKH